MLELFDLGELRNITLSLNKINRRNVKTRLDDFIKRGITLSIWFKLIAFTFVNFYIYYISSLGDIKYQIIYKLTLYSVKVIIVINSVSDYNVYAL